MPRLFFEEIGCGSEKYKSSCLHKAYPFVWQTDNKQTIYGEIQVVIDSRKTSKADEGKGRGTEEGGDLEAI